MRILNYSATISLDGYISDAAGGIEWATPSEDVFAMHLERISKVSTEILGRRTYELMEYWETMSDQEANTAAEQDFAHYWQAIKKVVVSSTLTARRLASPRARIIPELSLSDVRKIVAESTGDVEIFGPTTASESIRAGLIDRFDLFVFPISLGRGRKALPNGAYRKLKLTQQKPFDNGTVFLRYERQ